MIGLAKQAVAFTVGALVAGSFVLGALFGMLAAEAAQADPGPYEPEIEIIDVSDRSFD